MKRIIYTVVTACLCNFAHATNTGGVFPPTVNEGHKSWQYRVAVDPVENGSTRFAQRLHYQQAINDDLMWRIVGQVRKTDDSDFDPDFLQAELFLDLTKNNSNYQHGFRFDARMRDGDRPDQIGVNWIHRLNMSDGWSMRGIVLTSTQFGSNSQSGVNLQTRAQVAKSFGSGKSVGLELYNNYGNSRNIGSFDQQDHTIGPIISTPITKNLSVFWGVLFGVSDAAPDQQFRLWITRPL